MGPNLPVVDLGKGVVAKTMCTGLDFSCAVTGSGAVKCWGDNSKGALGQGHYDDAIGGHSNQMGDALPYTQLGEDFVATDIQCGWRHVCALNPAGKVKCWGAAGNGEVGNPVLVETVGNQERNMGKNLPYLPLPESIKHIAPGADHTCAATKDAVYCWGSNGRGEGGIESPSYEILLSVDQSKLSPVKLESDGTRIVVEGITSGFGYSCAMYHISNRNLSLPSKVKCWGSNVFGNFGIGSTVDRLGSAKGTMGAALPPLQLAMAGATAFESYNSHSCALMGGQVKCWGGNRYGQLGYEDSLDRGRELSDMVHLNNVALGLPVLSIGHGTSSQHTCAILINHEVKCWGEGFWGALGYEDRTTRGVASGDMSDNLPFVNLK